MWRSPLMQTTPGMASSRISLSNHARSLGKLAHFSYLCSSEMICVPLTMRWICAVLLRRGARQPVSLGVAEQLRVIAFGGIREIAVVDQDDFDALAFWPEVIVPVDAFALAARVVGWHIHEVECEALCDCFEWVSGMRVVPSVVMVVPSAYDRELFAKGRVVGIAELLLVFGFDH